MNPLHFSISDRMAPDDGQRRALAARKSQIDTALANPAGKAEIGKFIVAMGVNFAPVRRSEEEADALLAAYCKQLAEFPAWLIAEVCDDYCKGRVTGNDFMPIPPKLAEACRSRMYQYKGESYGLGKILTARITQERSDEERAMMSEKFSAFLREAQGWGEEPKAEQGKAA